MTQAPENHEAAMDLGTLVVSSSPHLRAPDSVSQIMWTVVLALLPAFCAAAYTFGLDAVRVTFLAIATAVATEAACQALRRERVAVSDGSAVVTGMLLAFVLPPDVSWYVPVVGSVVAIAVAKQAFGGLGCNFFNPALIGRAFLQFAFADQLTRAEWPFLPGHAFSNLLGSGVDAISQATPLAVLKTAQATAGTTAEVLDAFYRQYGLENLVLGRVPGSIGEVSALALLLGGFILIANRCINWRLPVAMIATVAIAVLLLPVRRGGEFTGGLVSILNGGAFDQGKLALYHLFAGGLFLGAFFMATDMVTSPITARGQVVFGIGAGLLVALIRLYGGYPEGVCYAILLMNAARPLIDRYTRPRVFGTKRKEAARA